MSSGSGAMSSAAITSRMHSLVAAKPSVGPYWSASGRGLLRDPRHLRGEALGREGRGVGKPAGERDHLGPRGDRHQVPHRRGAHHLVRLANRPRVALEVRGVVVGAPVRRGGAAAVRGAVLGLGHSSSVPNRRGMCGARPPAEPSARGDLGLAVGLAGAAVAPRVACAARALAALGGRRPRSLHGPAPPPGPGHPLRAAGPGAAAPEPRRLAREPDPRLRRQRLPRWRVPLPGLPLRRPRRQGDLARSRRPARPAATRFSAPNGTYTYPTDPAYADNAADLVELRVKPLADATAFRITLNTMKDPTLVGDDDRDRRTRRSRASSRTARTPTAPAQPLPHRSRHARRPGRRRHRAAASAPAPTGDGLDRRRQIEVRVPHAAWDPGRRTVRLAAGVGLWDTGGQPLPGARARPPTRRTRAARRASPSRPPSSTSPSATPSPGSTPYPPRLGVHRPGLVARPRSRATALASGDLSPFHAEVDFGKLARGRDRRHARASPTACRQSGPMDRILASHFETSRAPTTAPPAARPTDCQGELRGPAPALRDLRARQADARRRATA